MTLFSSLEFDGHEQVLFVHDAESELCGIIAVHSTRRGPALGGCRVYPYADEDDAIRDVLRLSRGMSYKAAIADVPLGGGKCVIIADPKDPRKHDRLRAIGRAIERFGGAYITGEDIGTGPSDMAIIREETRAVSCVDERDGGYGDPARFTALGVFQAMKAAAQFRLGRDNLQGLTVAVQGVGNVGAQLCRLLFDAGARLVVCDSNRGNAERARAFGAVRVDCDEIYDAAADIFAPCAIGATVNRKTIPRLRASIVAGAANNQLGVADDAHALARKGITYVPDYVANGGGLISCAAEWFRTERRNIQPKVEAMYETVLRILMEANDKGITPLQAADSEAERKLDAPKRGAAAQARGALQRISG